MDKSAYMAQQSSKRIQDSLNGISSTIKGLVATALTMATIERIWEGFKNVYEAEKILEKMAIRLGTTSAELSALQYAAKKSGIDIDVFNTSIQRMEKNISTAALPAKNTGGIMGDMGEEVGKSSEAFRNLGINANALKMLPLKEQLLAISERLKLVPNEADKVRIALDIFGKGGGGMVVMLKAGEEAIDAWIDRGRELGVVLDNDMVKRGAAAGKSIGELKDAVYGFGLTLADTVAPPIKLVTDALTEKLVAIRAADPALRDLVQTVKDFAEAWAEPALNALKMGVIGGRIAGLQGAALGAAAGFAGLTTSLRELADALQNPLVLAFLGGAAGSRLGVIGAGAGALAGATAGIALGVKKDAAAYQKSMQEDLSGYESPIGGFEPGMKAQLDYEKSIKKYQGLFTEPSFGKPSGGGKRGGGGGGAKDTGLDRMQSIIDGLQKDLSRLTEGSLAEIEQWAKKTTNEIEKVGKKGAETETALTLVAQVEAAKKQKATEDYNLFVAKSSGNAFAEIEAQGKADLDKYKGFAGAKEVIAADVARKTWEQQVKNYQDILGLQKNIYDSLASLSPIIGEQNALKRKSLDLEIEINKYAMSLKITELERAGIISKAQSDEFRGLQALEAQAKKTNLAMEQNKGISGWAFERNKTVGQQNTIKDLMGGAENFLQQSFSSGIQGVLAHDKNNLKKIGETIMQGFLGEMTKRSVTQVFDKLAEVINPNKGIGGLPASIEGSNNLTQLQTAAAAGSVKAAQALDQSAQGLTGSSKGLKDSAGGLGMSGAQLGLSAGGLMLSGIGIMTNSQALVTAGMVLQVGGLALQTAATLLMLAATTDFIPFFHSGGLITAHSGYLANDERLIKVQTGERVLSRKQNRDFEAGTNAVGNGVIIPPININFSPSYSYRPTQQDMNRDVKMVVKAMKREMGNIFSG